MAKRFIDTGILKHHFTRGLSATHKLLWIHILTDCSYAGMWQVDWDIAEILIGSKIDRNKIENVFEGKILKLKNGAIWFLPDFIDFQYGRLSEKNQAHKGIISILSKENLLNDDLSLKGLPSPSQAPCNGAKDKDKDKEKEMDKEKEKAEPEFFGEMEHPYLTKIKADCQILLKMKFPLTQDEAKRLEVDIGDAAVIPLLDRMSNWKKITSNNVSVNKTLRAWHEKDTKNPTTINGNQNPNSSAADKTGGISNSRIRNTFNQPKIPLD